MSEVWKSSTRCAGVRDISIHLSACENSFEGPPTEPKVCLNSGKKKATGCESCDTELHNKEQNCGATTPKRHIIELPSGFNQYNGLPYLPKN
jgi:hypothetical protein